MISRSIMMFEGDLQQTLHWSISLKLVIMHQESADPIGAGKMMSVASAARPVTVRDIAASSGHKSTNPATLPGRSRPPTASQTQASQSQARSRPSIYDTRLGTTDGLRAADHTITIRVDRLSSNTTTGELRDYIINTVVRGLAADKLSVEELPAPDHILSPTYKCFKVTLPRTDKDKIMDADLWPVGAFVRFYRRPRPTQIPG